MGKRKAKDEKTSNKRKIYRVIIALVVLVVVIVFARVLIAGGAIGMLVFDSMTAKIMVDTDVTHYNQYMGADAKEEYRSKFGMDEDIFPAEITDEMNVIDYKMVYYNPWDAQYLSYLVVDYPDEAYETEVSRLKAYPSNQYVGYYGAEGFDEQYELLAMHADSYQGFVYALTDGQNQIIYVEIIFCNYFMNLDYPEYIDRAYLPEGFDATRGNLYLKEKTGDND